MSVDHRVPAAVEPRVVPFTNTISGTALAERTVSDSSANANSAADEKRRDGREAAQNDNPARGEQPTGDEPERAATSALSVASNEASGTGSEQGPTPPGAEAGVQAAENSEAQSEVQTEAPADPLPRSPVSPAPAIAPEQLDVPRKPTDGSAGLVPPVMPGKPLAGVPAVRSAVHSAPHALDSPITALAMAASNATAALATAAPATAAATTAPATAAPATPSAVAPATPSAPAAANVQGALPGSTPQSLSTHNPSAPNVSTHNPSTHNLSTPNVSTPNVSTPNVSTPNVSTPQGATLPVSIPGHAPQGVPGLSAEQMQFAAMNAMSAGAFPPQYGAPWFAPGMPLNMFAPNSAGSDKAAPGAHAGTLGTPGMPGTPQPVSGGTPGMPSGIPGFGAYPGAYAFNSPFTPGMPPSAGFTPGTAPTPGGAIAPVGSLDLSQLAPSNPMLAMSMGMQLGMPMGYPGMMLYPPMLPNQFPGGMAMPPGLVPPMGAYGAFGNLAIAQAAQARAAQAAQAQAVPSPNASMLQPSAAQPVRPSAGSPQHSADTVKPEALVSTPNPRAPSVPSAASPGTPRTPGTPTNVARQESAPRSASSQPSAQPQASTQASSPASTQASTPASTKASTPASTKASTQPKPSTQHTPVPVTTSQSSPQADAQRFSARKTMFRISSPPKEPPASATENAFMRQKPVGTLWPPGMMPPPNVAPSGDMPPPPPALTNPTRIDSSLYEDRDRERERHDYEALRRRRDSYLAGTGTKPPKLPRSKRYWLDQQAELVSNLERRGFVAIYRETPEYSRFFCSLCNKDFETKLLCIRHAVEHLNFKPFRCTDCDMEFTRCDTLQRHLKGRCLGPESHLYQSAAPKRETASADDEDGAPPAVKPGEGDAPVELVRVNMRRRNRVDKTRFADDDAAVRPPAAMWHAPEGFAWKKTNPRAEPRAEPRVEPPVEPPAKRVKQDSPPAQPVRKGPAPVVMPAARRG